MRLPSMIYHGGQWLRRVRSPITQRGLWSLRPCRLTGGAGLVGPRPCAPLARQLAHVIVGGSAGWERLASREEGIDERAHAHVVTRDRGGLDLHHLPSGRPAAGGVEALLRHRRPALDLNRPA